MAHRNDALCVNSAKLLQVIIGVFPFEIVRRLFCHVQPLL